MIMQMIMAFFSTLCFSIFFNAPKDKLLYCSIAGSFGWGVYRTITDSFGDAVLASFFATLFIAALARHFSMRHRHPVTIFLIPGIIPLVPGAGVYYTMYSVIMGELYQALYRGVETLKIAGAISLGIIFILAMPGWVLRKINSVLPPK